MYLDDKDPIFIGRAYGRVSRHLLHEELLKRYNILSFLATVIYDDFHSYYLHFSMLRTFLNFNRFLIHINFLGVSSQVFHILAQRWRGLLKLLAATVSLSVKAT